VAPAGAISAIALMAALPLTTWIRLIVWFVIGIVVYFSYGIRQSKLARPQASSPTALPKA
jgi:APA family basic amino acid/polyamine antiporter